MKESIARLNTEIARLRATGVAELQPMIDEKQAELYKKRESLNRLESRLFDLALSINKLIGSGTPVSERKRLAIEMFERGNSKGVVEILNEKDKILYGYEPSIMLFAQTVNFELQSGGRGTHAACNKSIAQAGRLRNERQNLHLETARCARLCCQYWKLNVAKLLH